MKKPLITILSLCLLSLWSCDKPNPEDQLPPITQNGANTFGCLINGKVFIPKEPTGWDFMGGSNPARISIYTGNSYENSDYFSLGAKNYGTGIYVYIYIPEDVPKLTTYTFSKSPGETIASIKPNFPHMLCFFTRNPNPGNPKEKYISSLGSGSVTFTKASYLEGTYAGTFKATLYNANDSKDRIEVTLGRFDIDLGTLKK